MKDTGVPPPCRFPLADPVGEQGRRDAERTSRVLKGVEGWYRAVLDRFPSTETMCVPHALVWVKAMIGPAGRLKPIW